MAEQEQSDSDSVSVDEALTAFLRRRRISEELISKVHSEKVFLILTVNLNIVSKQPHNYVVGNFFQPLNF